MAFFLDEPKDGEKFSSIRPIKWTEVSTVLSFDELRVASSDGKHRLFMVLNKDIKALAKDASGKSSPVEKTTGVLLQLDSKRKPTTWQGKTTEVSRMEAFLNSQIDKLDNSKSYKGSIALQDSPMLEMLISGTDATGQPIEPGFAATAWAMIWNLQETEPNLIKPEDCTAPKGGSGSWGGSKGQTELEKLNDRLEFFRIQVAKVDPDYKVDSPFDLTETAIAISSTTKINELLVTIDACAILMGLPRSFN